MKEFKEHNRYTRATYWVLFVGSAVGFVFVGGLLLTGMTLKTELPKMWFVVLTIILSGMLIANSYIAYKIYKKSYSAFRLCLILYGIQILGFETENWALQLNFGMSVAITIGIGSVKVTLNMMAIAIVALGIKAMKTLKPSR